MSDWHTFLKQQGAQLHKDGIHSFGETPRDYPVLLAEHTLLFALDHLGTLTLRDGVLADGGKKMLQGQLTCDVDTLTHQHSIRGAHCTPKGRTIANFRLLMNIDHSIDLIMPKQQLEATTQSLGRYAPFFKMSMDAGNRRLLGLSGPAAAELCKLVVPALPDAPNASAHNQGNSVIQVDKDRYLLLVSPEQAEATWTSLTSRATPAGNPLWALLNVRAGIGTVTEATREEFIPQMLNLQATGDISFKKGCYTGQEVVARMHYLGKLKRRMYRLQITAHTPPASGQNCYLADKQQSQGIIVCAANCDEDTVEALVVLTEQAADSQQLLLGNAPETAQAVTIKQLSLPYSTDTQR